MDETADGTQNIKKKKSRNKNRNGRLIINICNSHYPVIKTVAKMYKLRTTISENDDWDIYW